MKTKIVMLFGLVLLLVTGCAARGSQSDTPALPQPQNTSAAAKASASPGKGAADLVPQRLSRNEEGVPVLNVYDVKNGKLE